ncbi:hypothetical protein [Pedobacter alpinus]|uniref:Pesticidal protein Cry7Aa n=1 Tax=Pedobacter alpinus TaxID=1590643 RepID=A0ABW5TSW6_9SPHI
MMIEVKKHGVLLSKRNIGFECDGVLNPAVIKHNEHIYLFYRAVGKNNYSTIGYCKLKDPLNIEEQYDMPILFPQFDYESHGIEDPRIVKIDDLFYLTYTAYDGKNALGALAVSKDLKHFEKLGIIVPQIAYEEFKHLTEAKGVLNAKYLRYNNQTYHVAGKGRKALIWDKNLVFFPRKINGKLFFLHRIKPDIQLASFTSLDELTPSFWQHYFLHLEEHIVLSPSCKHEISYIGGGCPPIETKQGWLLIYHAVYDTVNGYVYTAAAALLDLNNPLIEIARLPYPLFKPDLEWEMNGEVNNVCFPTGTVVIDDTIYIYYGAADEQIACASVKISALVEELMLNKKHYDN